MARIVGLFIGVVVICTSTGTWGSFELSSPTQSLDSFFIHKLGIQLPSAVPLQPLGVMRGVDSPMGENRYYQSDGRYTVPGFQGLDLALAPYAAPGVWLDAGRFGIHSLAFCDWQSGQCPYGIKTDYALAAAGQGDDKVGLEIRDDKTAGVAAALSSNSKVMELGLYGSHLRQQRTNAGLDDAQDSEVMLVAGASSLPGASNPQRTEIGWLYQDSVLPAPQDMAQLNRQRQRLMLQHQAGIGRQNTTHTRIFWQESRLGFAVLPELPSIAPVFEDSLLATNPPSASLGAPGGIKLRSAGVAEYKRLGIEIESLISYGEHSLRYQASYHEDNAKYADLGFPQAIGINTTAAIRDSADVLSLGLESRFDFTAFTLAMDGGWINAALERKPSDSAPHSRVDGWQYAVGVLLTDPHVGLWGRRGFTPPSPGNLDLLPQSFDGISLEGSWPLGALVLTGQLWGRRYENLHLDCTELAVCPGIKGLQQLNAQHVDARGGALELNWLGELGALKLPVVVGLERSHAKFDSGQCLYLGACVEAGETLSWQPEQQIRLALGAELGKWSLSLTGRELEYPREKGRRLDVSLQWQQNQHSVYLRADNLTAESLRNKSIDGEGTAVFGSELGMPDGEMLFSVGYRWRQ